MSYDLMERCVLQSEALYIPRSGSGRDNRVRHIVTYSGGSYTAHSFVVIDDYDPPSVEIVSSEISKQDFRESAFSKLEPTNPSSFRFVKSLVITERIHFSEFVSRSVEAISIELSDGRCVRLERDFSHVYQESFTIDVT